MTSTIQSTALEPAALIPELGPSGYLLSYSGMQHREDVLDGRVALTDLLTQSSAESAITTLYEWRRHRALDNGASLVETCRTIQRDITKTASIRVTNSSLRFWKEAGADLSVWSNNVTMKLGDVKSKLKSTPKLKNHRPRLLPLSKGIRKRGAEPIPDGPSVSERQIRRSEITGAYSVAYGCPLQVPQSKNPRPLWSSTTDLKPSALVLKFYLSIGGWLYNYPAAYDRGRVPADQENIVISMTDVKAASKPHAYELTLRVNGKVCGLLGPWDRIHAHIGYESESD
ncbi:hypothetical protein SISNIDRAFT_469572 [Sistotremastrum niveocremeum HHB9708]|uniref:Uncharacterized protein n=1 Tax=Sistotremastrum niveocremeum HHB9708 TaxID=1314777 RepID=A0A164PVA1_9AGAM|nr:hypothetical protein SISNIDRAFT_469572 [Sistotremastrum niveocremeum HHB9708]